MTDEQFVREIKDYRELSGGKSVTIALDDFDKLIEIAERKTLELLPSDCTCTADQYGCATNPKCILHGDRR
jgi:hypothetical protein